MLTKTQQQEITKILDMSEKQLDESIMNEASLKEIQQKISAVVKDVNPPKFFKRLL